MLKTFVSTFEHKSSMANLAQFFALQGVGSNYATQTRRQLDGVSDDTNDNFVNVVEMLISVVGLAGGDKSDAFVLVGEPGGDLVDPDEDNALDSLNRQFLDTAQAGGGPGSILEYSKADLVAGLRADPPKVIINDELWVRVEDAADVAKETLQEQVGYEDAGLEAWTMALMATKDVRTRFARLVVANQNLFLGTSSSVNNTRVQRNSAGLDRRAARLRLAKLAPQIEANLGGVTGTRQVRPRLV